MEETKSLIDRLNALRESGALTEAEHKLMISKVLSDVDDLADPNVAEAKLRNFEQEGTPSPKNKQNKIRNILIIGGVFIIILVTFLVVSNNKNSVDTHSGEPISVNGSIGLEIDNSSSLNIALKQFGILDVQPGASLMNDQSNTADELFAETVEFVPVCARVFSLTGLLGDALRSKPKVIFTQKNGNYAGEKISDPGFSYSVSVIDSASITDEMFSQMVMGAQESCRWTTNIIANDGLVGCSIDVSPWIDEECASKSTDGFQKPFLFGTDYKSDSNMQWLKARTILLEKTTTNFETVTVRKLIRASGKFDGIVEISIEIRTTKRWNLSNDLAFIAEKVFDDFEKIVFSAMNRNPGGYTAFISGAPSSATWTSIAPTSQSQQVGSTCADQWDKAHAETMAGGSSDSELRQTVFSCNSVSEWTQEAKRVGEFFPYLLDSICLLVTGAPSAFCP
jgi:hypothetical protein